MATGPGTSRKRAERRAIAKTGKARDDIRTGLRALLRDYMNAAGTSQSGAVRDLLTELMHLCDSRGLDFSGRVRLALEVYREESAIRRPLGGGG